MIFFEDLILNPRRLTTSLQTSRVNTTFQSLRLSSNYLPPTRADSLNHDTQCTVVSMKSLAHSLVSQLDPGPVDNRCVWQINSDIYTEHDDDEENMWKWEMKTISISFTCEKYISKKAQHLEWMGNMIYWRRMTTDNFSRKKKEKHSLTCDMSYRMLWLLTTLLYEWIHTLTLWRT